MTRNRSRPPAQTPNPLPTPLATSRAPAASPLPLHPRPIPDPSSSSSTTNNEPGDSEKNSARPTPHPPLLPTPKLLLQVHDLSHPGALIFFTHINPTALLADALTTVLQTLYMPPPSNRRPAPCGPIPPTRSVTLVLRSMPGVAYTTGTELDDDHKEIHFSLDYVEGIAAERRRAEMVGVVVHEMVHAWQWSGGGTAPGGLVEGVADFVRLKAGLAPPHWRRGRGRGEGGDWDAGYDQTAFFLEWLEGRVGEGSVRRINEGLRGRKYEGGLWVELFGRGVEDLWAEYRFGVGGDGEGGGKGVGEGRGGEGGEWTGLYLDGRKVGDGKSEFLTDEEWSGTG